MIRNSPRKARARREQRYEIPVAKIAILEQRHRQRPARDLIGDQRERESAHDDDLVGARRLGEPHGVRQQRLARDRDQRLGQTFGEGAEPAPQPRGQ